MAAPDSPRTLAGVARWYFAHRCTSFILASMTPLLVLRLFQSNWALADGLIALVAVLAWPFFEYAFHVAIHLPPLRFGAFRLELEAARRHRQHHLDPTRIDDVLLPMDALVFLAVVSIVGFWWLLGWPLGLTAAICFHLGGLANGWVHLLTHSNYSPQGRYYSWVRRSHLLHHFKSDRYWFAFTGPHVDVLLGTYRKPDELHTHDDENV